MDPLQDMPQLVPVLVPVAVPTPLVARRVRPPQAKPVEAKPPTPLETVAKVVNDVAKIADVVGKLFKTDAKPAARAATHVQPDFTGDAETLPDTAFGGDWGVGDVPTPPALPESSGWDFSQMLGFDPSQMLDGFDPTQMLNGFDPTQMLNGFDPTQMLNGFDPTQMLDGFDPNAGW